MILIVDLNAILTVWIDVLSINWCEGIENVYSLCWSGCWMFSALIECVGNKCCLCLFFVLLFDLFYLLVLFFSRGISAIYV